MKTGVLSLYRDGGVVVLVGYDFLVGLPEPKINLVPPFGVDLADDEIDELELEVLQREGERDD